MTTMDQVGAPASMEQLAAQVAQLAAELAEVRQTLTDKSATPGGQPPLYDNVEQWVRDWLLVNIDRPFGETGGQWRWCEQWWAHNEAVLGLTALWYAWEHARLEQTGMLGWLREAHYHLQVLCSADGPLRDCAPAGRDQKARHNVGAFAQVTDSPAGWFDWWDNDGGQ
jgi:Domain of unknown function (DUF4913)